MTPASRSAKQPRVRRVAAIDVGTNSVRLLVAQVDREGTSVLDEEKAQVRLGEGLSSTGDLSEEAQVRTLDALARMLTIAQGRQADIVRAVATHAVRTACNGAEFVERIEREIGLSVEVATAEEEARFAFLGAAANFDLTGRTAVVDVGGGSVEIVRATDGAIESVTSMPLGVVVLTEMLPSDEDPPCGKALKRVRRHIRRTLDDAFGARPDPVGLVVGSGGTVTSLGAMVAAQLDEDFASVQGREIAAADVVHAYAFLRGLPLETRRQVPGLPPDRADIIVAGALLLREIMARFQANRLAVNTKGLREGVLLDTVAEVGRRSSATDEHAALTRFARRCRADMRHAQHVTELALSIFDQIADASLTDQDRRLLEAAGLLHDVGYFIAYRRHHKHSYHLISHADLPGFSPREIAVIAAVARYHRGANPKLRHEEFARLTPEDRATVTRLGGILRLADGLDRGRSQRVSSVELRRDDGVVRVALSATADPHVELFGASQKSDLFRKAFDVALEVTADV